MLSKSVQLLKKRRGVKPLAESGGQGKFSFERPKTVQWVRAEDQPMLDLLSQILAELKILNAKR